MPKQEIVTIKTERMQILDPEGNYDSELEPSLSKDDLIKILHLMILTRIFDQKGFSLQRQGRMLTFAPVEGQEACQIGSTFAMSREDWAFPTYREHGVGIGMGMPLDLMYRYWMGDEDGARAPDGINYFMPAIPIASQILHSVGIGIAARLKGDKTVGVAYFGDGGTSEGDFHEGLNFAGVFKAQAVFICQNNLYAISVPRERQTASQTIAQKAFSYGLHGIQVDGMDVLAVYKATKDALERARNGEGGTLIECITYRYGSHTTADDPKRYRSEEEVAQWREKDPIKRFRIYLEKKGIWTKELEEKIQAEAKEMVEKAVEKAESVPLPRPEKIFEHVYSELPPHVKEQLEKYEKLLREKQA